MIFKITMIGKFSIIFVLLLITYSQSASVFFCPSSNVANQFHPHATDITKYYNCTRGIATEDTCGDNMIFSKMTNKCTVVWPDAIEDNSGSNIIDPRGDTSSNHVESLPITTTARSNKPTVLPDWDNGDGSTDPMLLENST
ncbi:uncharacterized protein LOC134214589 [Armigeres subalbatus]|uniref:uncharacterized protein LOC134214589 n=1 Tax=Armigeres subalbatus TaxID=124917 RepID=UPI002ED314B3